MTAPAPNPTLPAELAALPEARIEELDLRPLVAAGGSPCNVVTEIPARLPQRGAVRLRVPFEPVPLYAVMAGRGLDHWTRCHAPDDWEVWFWRTEAARDSAEDEAAASCRCGCGGAEAGETVLDVRGLEPPEPMQRTLEALDRLPVGRSLLQKVDRVPRFLLPILEERGFVWTVVAEGPGGVEVRITRAHPGA